MTPFFASHECVCVCVCVCVRHLSLVHAHTWTSSFASVCVCEWVEKGRGYLKGENFCLKQHRLIFSIYIYFPFHLLPLCQLSHVLWNEYPITSSITSSITTALDHISIPLFSLLAPTCILTLVIFITDTPSPHLVIKVSTFPSAIHRIYLSLSLLLVASHFHSSCTIFTACTSCQTRSAACTSLIMATQNSLALHEYSNSVLLHLQIFIVHCCPS